MISGDILHYAWICCCVPFTDDGHSYTGCLLQQPEGVHRSGEDQERPGCGADDAINQHGSTPLLHGTLCKRGKVVTSLV